MKRKSTSDVGQLWKIGKMHPAKGNTKMILPAWRQKEQQMLVNVETLVKFIMLAQILK